MTLSDRFAVSTRVLRRLALASIITNVLIVVTGGSVRLTGSGLGCPTWPRCTDDSYVPNAAMGINAAIEFGNRMVTWVVGAVALASLVAAVRHRPRRPSLIWLATAVLAGIAAQGVVGGIAVHSDLEPWIVGVHFVLSMALLLATYAFWRRCAEADGPATPLVGRPLRLLTWATAATSAAVLVVGVIVTGSGPHAGDASAARNGLDPELVAQAHADLVFLLIGLTVALYLALWAVGAPSAAVRSAGVLLVIEAAQGVIGFVQYFTDLPALLVGAHMLGACLVRLATLALLWSVRERRPLSQRETGPAPSTIETAGVRAGS